MTLNVTDATDGSIRYITESGHRGMVTSNELHILRFRDILYNDNVNNIMWQPVWSGVMEIVSRGTYKTEPELREVRHHD
jgi:hypothetical protein